MWTVKLLNRDGTVLNSKERPSGEACKRWARLNWWPGIARWDGRIVIYAPNGDAWMRYLHEYPGRRMQWVEA